MAESIDFNEERMVNEGGKELEEVDERAESAKEQKERDPDTLATPTELEQGGTMASGDAA